ncbi:3-oxoacyl-[acyl-carrier-protein] synthase II [Saccharopolyspora erythraea NRRL 2338]|uniref:3-oxoacyl-[acyl-carrier-protein] synthase n=2 Tax=Saccharopolyspora erythraea TaxID=1836 RepID=A4F9X0_SACEN|nr:beta-ketoacyl-[acyl-carrier-protein] synthase family protein [Saccharopolyspora erythraea]EQD83246.1 3-oxoacyl-ACP synthase [Saccharopolyspora erythraea D]PFG94632.1 3-oxoacyl-[acyl-carrier-protein] synthase II [Saccharopolyspora erythraea NRRL 2338]QRK91363.1 beta-ketoacyl-[acyl-carrier-protein] synthase family protein [Saccharopolyspora erythraea]CAM00845.1 3-oxoacyl-[acyl-carrier-protein] synthase [Saccharopolyspora erythraea NRRL 2338]
MTTDVVITGLGATTPLGGDVASTWDGVINGRSGVRRLEADWIDRFDLPAKIGAPLAVEPSEVLPRVQLRRMDRCEQIAVIAAREAWADAGYELPTDDSESVDPDRLGIAIGTGIGGPVTLLQQDDLLEEHGLRKVSPLTVPMLMPNGPAAYVSLDLRARAGVHSPASACASGAEGLAKGWEMIRSGQADVVVAGGAEACIHPITIAGFAQARTLSTRNDDPEAASRPFDVDRDGFVMGEGAGVMVLESAEHARARGARIYGRLAGIGITSDAYHITGSHPDGIGQTSAIRKALRSGELSASDIGHVNAHATSTVVGDIGEANSVRKALGTDAVLTAPKGALGHLVGGAGAVESIVTVLSLRDGVIPATRNLENVDPKIELDVVADKPRHVEQTAAVNDAFGFGGHNVALAFARS